MFDKIVLVTCVVLNVWKALISLKLHLKRERVVIMKQRMREVPYFSETNIDYDYFNHEELNLYEKLQELRNTLFKRKKDDCHLLNRDNVTGLWIFTDLSDDNNPQLIMRSTLERGSYERLLLIGEIFNIFNHDVVYDYYLDIINEEEKVAVEEVIGGRVRTIYDKERDG